MNALDHLLADIRRAHHGEPLKPAPRHKTTACPQGQASKPPRRPRSAPAVATHPATVDTSPAIARALDVLRAAMRSAA